MLPTKEEYEASKTSYEAFCKVLENMHHKTVEDTLRSLPNLLLNIMKYTGGMNVAVEQFYEENKEFLPHKELVAITVGELESMHPGLNLEELLKKAAPIVAERLKTASGLNTNSIGRPGADKLNSLLNEVYGNEGGVSNNNGSL